MTYLNLIRWAPRAVWECRGRIQTNYGISGEPWEPYCFVEGERIDILVNSTNGVIIKPVAISENPYLEPTFVNKRWLAANFRFVENPIGVFYEIKNGKRPHSITGKRRLLTGDDLLLELMIARKNNIAHQLTVLAYSANHNCQTVDVSNVQAIFDILARISENDDFVDRLCDTDGSILLSDFAGLAVSLHYSEELAQMQRGHKRSFRICNPYTTVIIFDTDDEMVTARLKCSNNNIRFYQAKAK